jgi:hypothetical protein
VQRLGDPDTAGMYADHRSSVIDVQLLLQVSGHLFDECGDIVLFAQIQVSFCCNQSCRITCADKGSMV